MTERCHSSVTDSVITTDFVTLTVTVFVVGARINGPGPSLLPHFQKILIFIHRSLDGFQKSIRDEVRRPLFGHCNGKLKACSFIC
jgi:hypothetical protein